MSTSVWIVCEGDSDLNSVAGVFSTQEKAVEYVGRILDGKGGDYSWKIENDIDGICWTRRNCWSKTTEILSVMEWEVNDTSF